MEDIQTLKALLIRVYKEPAVISETEVALKNISSSPSFALLLIEIIKTADNLELARMAVVYLKRYFFEIDGGKKRIEAYPIENLKNVKEGLTAIVINYPDEKVICQCALILAKILVILYPHDM